MLGEIAAANRRLKPAPGGLARHLTSAPYALQDSKFQGACIHASDYVGGICYLLN